MKPCAGLLILQITILCFSLFFKTNVYLETWIYRDPTKKAGNSEFDFKDIERDFSGIFFSGPGKLKTNVWEGKVKQAACLWNSTNISVHCLVLFLSKLIKTLKWQFRKLFRLNLELFFKGQGSVTWIDFLWPLYLCQFICGNWLFHSFCWGLQHHYTMQCFHWLFDISIFLLMAFV